MATSFKRLLFAIISQSLRNGGQVLIGKVEVIRRIACLHSTASRIRPFPVTSLLLASDCSPVLAGRCKTGNKLNEIVN